MSASAGRVLIMPKGTYNPNTPYVLLDAVFYNGNSYIAKGDTLGNLPTDSDHWQILAQGAGVISGAFAGSCDSLGSAQVKTVIIPPADNFALQKGVIVGVRFTNTNTFEATSENSIALNVNSSGAIPIYFGGTATPLGSNIVAFGEADYTHYYQYDGTNWVFIGRSGVQTAEQTPYDSTKSTKEAIDEKQPQTLETPLEIGGVEQTTVEGALGGLNSAIEISSQTVTGNPLSFTTDSAQVAQNTVITFEPIQSGSGDPSPNNMRAISGYDEIDLAVPRKNLVYKTLIGYTINASKKIATDANINVHIAHIKQGVKYTLSKPTTEYASYGYFLNEPVLGAGTYDGQRPIISNDTPSFTFTAPIDGYIAYAVANTFSQPQIELGETATTYEPYNPITDISEDLDETRYGFTFDVESGELTIYKGSKTYNGSENWEQSANPNACRIPVPSDMDTDNPDTICDTYTYTTTPNDVNYGFAIGSYIAVKDVTNCSTVANFKTYLSGHNITFVYKLKNPITYQLTPHQVRLLQGANVVTSNGTSISLIYRNGKVMTLADAQGLADGINGLSSLVGILQKIVGDIAPYEDGETASKSYAVNDFFIRNNKFCKCISAISAGTAFTLNTNYQETTISAVLTSILNS